MAATACLPWRPHRRLDAGDAAETAQRTRPGGQGPKGPGSIPGAGLAAREAVRSGVRLAVARDDDINDDGRAVGT